MIKACVFDMGGVVLAFDFNPFYEKVLRHCPTGVCQADLEHLAAQRHDNLGCGLIPFQAYYEQFKTELGVSMDLVLFAEAWNNIFTEMPETLALIRRLRGVRKVMLSNTDEAHIAWIAQRFPHLFGLFDQLVFSHEIHARKPSAAAFRAAERVTGLAPSEHVLIDDMEENIVAAKECGWEGVVFRGAEQLERDLKKLEVAIEG